MRKGQERESRRSLKSLFSADLQLRSIDCVLAVQISWWRKSLGHRPRPLPGLNHVAQETAPTPVTFDRTLSSTDEGDLFPGGTCIILHRHSMLTKVLLLCFSPGGGGVLEDFGLLFPRHLLKVGRRNLRGDLGAKSLHDHDQRGALCKTHVSRQGRWWMASYLQLTVLEFLKQDLCSA